MSVVKQIVHDEGYETEQNMTIEITTIEDVKAFAKYLTNDLHLNFHPDDDFSFYVNYETKEPTFSPEEAAKYNALMMSALMFAKRQMLMFMMSWESI